MKPNYVVFVQTRLDLVPFETPHWWDSLRWSLVKLLGGENPHEFVKTTRIPIDDKEFMDRLWKQKRHLFDTLGREPATLLIGAEDYEEMMASPTIQQAITFNATFNYGRSEIYGLTVKVIPWMRGAVVMP